MADETSPSYMRQALAGLATVPGEFMRLGAYVANPARVVRKFTGDSTELDNSRYGEGYAPYNRIPQVLEGTADAWNELVSRQLGVKANPSPQDDTGEYAARLVGNTVPAIPGALIRGAGALAPSALQRLMATTPGKVVGKTAELLTPTTVIPSRIVPAGNRFATAGQIAPRWAANVGVQGAAGVALEHATEPYDPTVPFMDFDEKGQVTDAYFPGPEDTPGAGRVAARGVVSAVGDHPVAATLGGVALGAGALLARRKIQLNNSIREQSALSDAVGPKDPAAANVPIIDNPISNALHATGEVLADQDLRTKVGIDKAVAETNAKARAAAQAAGTPPPVDVSAQPVKDAISLTSESAHASRLESAVNDGTVVTPRGEYKIPSLREIAREVYGASTKVKDFAKRFNEYIAYADEINNRAYNAKKVAAKKQELVNIDRTTGEVATAATNPADIVREPARVNMWHLDTPTLQARRAAIEASPEGAQIKAIAQKYWQFHNRIADASMAFGVLSKHERALWGNANPEFRHTINLDRPKSPRTYRGRGHAMGAKVEGDALQSAGEYADYMIAQMHHNRKNNLIFDAIKDSKWVGQIADPAVLRRQTILDATTGLPRPMTKKDLRLNPANTRSFYRDGEIVDYEVNNPQMRFTIDKQPAHAQTMFGWLRGVAQSGMTGKLSLAIGQPFGLANAVMGSMFGAVARPAGRSIGKLDRGQKGVIGGVTRVLDPTTYGMNVWTAGADVKAVMHRAIADSVYNSISVQGGLSRTLDAANRNLPGWIKPADARGIADAAAQKYLSSPLAERQSRGGGNASTMGERDFDTPQGKVTLIDSIDPRYNSIRVLNKPEDLKSIWQEFNRTVTPANFKIGVRLISDIQEAVGNMAQSSLYRQNRGASQALDTAAKIPEQARDAALAAAKPYLDRAAHFTQNARNARAIGNKQLASAQYQQARAQKALADPHLRIAEQQDVLVKRAREEWFREVSSLNVASRQLLGDSGASGSGLANYRNADATWAQRAVGATLNSVPYGNIGMQASARLIKAIKDDPAGTTAALATMAGSLATISLGSAELYDEIMGTSGTPDSAVLFDMERPNWHQARYVIGYIPGVPLERQPATRIDPTLQLLMSIARQGGMWAMGWLGGADDPIKAYTREHILEIVKDRTRDLLTTAAVNTLPVNQLPPAIGAGFAALGVEPPTGESIVNRAGVSMIPQRGLGGFEDTRNAQDIIGKRATAVLGQIWGTAGATVTEGVRQGWQGERHEPGSFASRAVGTIIGKDLDRLSEFQPLWNQQSRRATNDFFADAVNAKEQKVENIRQNMTAVAREGALGVGRSQTLDSVGGGMQGAPDDLKATLARTAQFGQSLTALRQKRESTRQELLSVDQQNLDYAARRNKQNELSKEVQRINRELLAHYTQFEDDESSRIGRKFRLDNLDPTQGLRQFPVRH